MAAEQKQTYGTQRQAAARKHAAILEAAHDLFAADPTVSLNEVAKRAGVGAGTLYRHFPSREDLILAVYRYDVQRLVDSVDELLGSGSARDGFVAWFERLAAYIRVKHGLGEALHSAAVQDAINETYAPVTAAVGRLLDACVAEGSVEAGHDPADVLLLMSFLWRVAPGDDGVAQGRRLIGMVFEGIGARPQEPVSGA
jgi:AcrR family transcriptional regulator